MCPAAYESFSLRPMPLAPTLHDDDFALLGAANEAANEAKHDIEEAHDWCESDTEQHAYGKVSRIIPFSHKTRSLKTIVSLS